MPIPDLNLKYEVRAKVRTGKKNDRKFPVSTDYFLSDDPEVQKLGIEPKSDGSEQQPTTLRIVLPHAEVEDNFNTGLEWWVKGGKGNTLACYTKDSSAQPTALRLPAFVSEQDEVRGEARGGQGRIPIACPFRACPKLKDKSCKPMGRLVFFLQGGRTDAVLELDTKSWNSVERLTATLTGARIQGPLTGRVFDLHVAFEQKGANRFPVLSLTEVNVEINNTKDEGLADAVVAYHAAVARGEDEKKILAEMLDHAHDGWRDIQKIVDWVKEVGVKAAIEALLARAA